VVHGRFYLVTAGACHLADMGSLSVVRVPNFNFLCIGGTMDPT